MHNSIDWRDDGVTDRFRELDVQARVSNHHKVLLQLQEVSALFSF